MSKSHFTNRSLIVICLVETCFGLNNANSKFKILFVRLADVHIKEWFKLHVHDAGWLARVHSRNACADIFCKLYHVNAAAQVKKHLRGEFGRLNFEASCDLHETSVRAFLWVDSPHANLRHVHSVLTVSKAACTLINFYSGLGSHSSPPSLLPHPCYHAQLIDVDGTYQYRHVTTFFTFQKYCMISFLVLRNDSAGGSQLTSLSLFSSQKQWFWEYYGSGPRILNDWCGKMTLQGMMHML
jgi:hypothetical protein